MTRNLLYKEFKLAAHPTMYIFLSFGLMLLIPAYPYYVAFFYALLAQFFVCLTGRENNDVFFTAMLPVAKRDVVKARLMLAGSMQLLTLLISVPFAILSLKINPGGNAAGIESNPAFYGLALMLLTAFNLTFYPAFYKTAYNAGGPFVKSTTLFFVLMLAAEALTWIPSPLQAYLDTAEPSMMLRQLPVLALGVLIWVFGMRLTYKLAADRFERVDL